MSTDAISLPDDLTLCHAIIAQLHEQLESSQKKIGHLEHQLDYLLRRIYGPKSERVDPNQLVLFELALSEEEKAAAASATMEPEPAKEEMRRSPRRTATGGGGFPMLAAPAGSARHCRRGKDLPVLRRKSAR